MWSPPAVLGYGHTSDGIGFWHRAHKWWNWLLAQEQDADMGVKENHVTQISHCQDRHFLHPRQIPPFPTFPVAGNPESLVPTAMGTSGGRGASEEAQLFFYNFLHDNLFPPTSITGCACEKNVTNINSCSFLWILQVSQREVELWRSTEESRLPCAGEWQKCPPVFCLWHRCQWESFNHTANLFRYYSVFEGNTQPETYFSFYSGVNLPSLQVNCSDPLQTRTKTWFYFIVIRNFRI